jgi:predicted metal-binding protein
MTTHMSPEHLTGAVVAPATLYVCLTCRKPGDEDAEPRAGARLHAALSEASRAHATGLTVVGVECLSNCKRGCTAALTSPGRWSYIYGDLDPATSPQAILDGVRRYQSTSDGLVPWRERPEIFKRGVIARLPAFTQSGAGS